MSRGAISPQVALTKAKTDSLSCIHRVFEGQARKTPDAVAVSFGGERLTYRELDERANQLARHLKKLGVKAETPVALYLERTP
jgi:non-ribosomal peptide synthetase component F